MRLEDSRSVEPSKKEKAKIRPILALDELYRVSLPGGAFSDYFEQLGAYVKQVAQAKGLKPPSDDAIKNVRGTWFEIIVAVKIWNYLTEYTEPDVFVLKLPNVTEFNFRKIFKPDTQAILRQLEESLQRADPPASLITSNPDLIIIKGQDVIMDRQVIGNLSQENITHITSVYKAITDSITWNCLKAGIGLKTSLRPDRRSQLVHEGNITKSLYAHLKMRYWDNKARLGYYCITINKTSEANDLALSTATTQSIISVDSRPERTVDKIFSVVSIEDIDPIIEEILGNHRD